MSRPSHIWVLFCFCLAVVLGAMGWVSATVLRLDRAEAEARRQAEIEESIRLALWRMDSSLAGLIARENARPYFAYNSFYPAERAYTRMFAEVQKGEVLIPSPLLIEDATFIVVHFQFDPSGRLSSPQVPEGNMRDLAEGLYTKPVRIEAASRRLKALGALVNRESLLTALSRVRRQPVKTTDLAMSGRAWSLTGARQDAADRERADLTDRERAGHAAAKRDRPSTAERTGPTAGERDRLSATERDRLSARERDRLPKAERDAKPSSSMLKQIWRSTHEWKARKQAQFSNVQQQVFTHRIGLPPGVGEGMMHPVWIDDTLLLARKVAVNGRDYVQGCQLDWPALREWLLSGVADLLPEAKLEKVRPEQAGGRSRLLAALPVRIVPGDVPAPAMGLTQPVRISLIIAWICVLLGAAAVAVLLRGAVSLSERRGAFVSAVTHELRTPLTTFRMYSEMLAEDMVTEEEKRRNYLKTLCTEADRLGRLVENVLAFARLERGHAGGRSESMPVGDLINRMGTRLADRADQAGMRLAVDAGEEELALSVKADPSAVEQILFNLVDNACKYAAGAPVNLIHLEVTRRGGRVLLRVRDHGAGIAQAESRHIFRPFHKSARDAANSAPGVGLGLALSRRLAREMSGDLSIDRDVKEGACFVLTLPRG
jgi:signal transduction histidine kinase